MLLCLGMCLAATGAAGGIEITVGVQDADIIGTDNKALQAAVDYVAALGGGQVLIRRGRYIMNDSLHLRSNVSVRGEGETVILAKGEGPVSKLALDGDYGEEQITLTDPDGFQVGDGVTVLCDRFGGFHTTVATILRQQDNTFAISKPLNADYMVHNNARAQKTFPIISGYYVKNCSVENITIDGNKEKNPPLNGCRGAGIFLYRAENVRVSNCHVSEFNGDGISFQQSNDILVEGCTTINNSALGIHPGSGSQRPIIRNNVSSQNSIGVFVCWRVKHGVIEDNIIKENTDVGISIGHKDTDNVIRGNAISNNRNHGILFRNEAEPMGAHRNRVENNVFTGNGVETNGAGILIRGETHDIVIQGNLFDGNPHGVIAEEKVDRISITNNTFRNTAGETILNKAGGAAVKQNGNKLE